MSTNMRADACQPLGGASPPPAPSHSLSSDRASPGPGCRLHGSSLAEHRMLRKESASPPLLLPMMVWCSSRARVVHIPGPVFTHWLVHTLAGPCSHNCSLAQTGLCSLTPLFTTPHIAVPYFIVDLPVEPSLQPCLLQQNAVSNVVVLAVR